MTVELPAWMKLCSTCGNPLVVEPSTRARHCLRRCDNVEMPWSESRPLLGVQAMRVERPLGAGNNYGRVSHRKPAEGFHGVRARGGYRK